MDSFFPQLVREIKCLGYFILLEHDISGVFVTIMNKVGVFRRKWNLKFNLERRLLHIIICVLITLTIQASFHVMNDLCIERRRCYIYGCSADYSTGEKVTETSDSDETAPQQLDDIEARSLSYRKCQPISTTEMEIGSSDVEWFVYPKPTEFNSQVWSHCNLQAQAAAQPNTCPHGIVCIPACKGEYPILYHKYLHDVSVVTEHIITSGSGDSRTFAPDHRPYCSKPKLNNILHHISDRQLENTLVCVVPKLPCYSHEFDENQRRIIVAAAYQIVSLAVRLLLVCGCVHKQGIRRRFRRLGYALCITVVGVTAGIYAFELTELTNFGTWVGDAVVSLIGGLIIQLVWITVVSWFILGSCSGQCCQSVLKYIPAKQGGHFDHFKLSLMHTIRQVCDDRRRKVTSKRYESPFEGVMTVCAQKKVQKVNEEIREPSSSDSFTSDEEEWSDFDD